MDKNVDLWLFLEGLLSAYVLILSLVQWGKFFKPCFSETLNYGL